jgi:hypothetical protein
MTTFSKDWVYIRNGYIHTIEVLVQAEQDFYREKWQKE